MKKVIGILGVVALTATLFLNSNSIGRVNNDSSLASLISVNSASAEEGECRTGIRWKIVWSYELNRNVCQMGGAACCDNV